MELGGIEQGMKATSPERGASIVEEWLMTLGQGISHLEKSVSSLTNRLEPVMSPDVPRNSDPNPGPMVPGGSSTLVMHLKEFYARVEALGDDLIRLNQRIEL